MNPSLVYVHLIRNRKTDDEDDDNWSGKVNATNNLIKKGLQANEQHYSQLKH